jgi:hypothetical protein
MLPSGSIEPASTAVAGTVAWQPALALTVTFEHAATGGAAGAAPFEIDEIRAESIALDVIERIRSGCRGKEQEEEQYGTHQGLSGKSKGGGRFGQEGKLTRLC